ncbi:hypothetical protein A0H81_07690 [Grifola frondosa]|uniref:Uncharacterized protein n=1 Tax=Grifola frondosa TaxID=5627 RepID=A0A1C7M7D5_GRIFR|nr:hypothetical protein A0H81_07690 [Grifola frondosa]
MVGLRLFVIYKYSTTSQSSVQHLSAPQAAEIATKTRVGRFVGNVLLGATLSFCYSFIALLLAPQQSNFAKMTILAILKATLIGSATLGAGGGILAVLISPHLSKDLQEMPLFVVAASSAWFGFPIGVAILHDTMPASIHPMAAFAVTIKVVLGIAIFVVVIDLGGTGLNKLWRWLKSENQRN